MRGGKWLFIPALMVLAGLVAGAVGLLRRESAAQPAQPAPAVAANRSAETYVSLPARIEAQHVVPVEAALGGVVEELLVDVGAEVYQGQLLARIGSQVLTTARESAHTSLESVRARVSKLEAALIAARLEASRARADAERARSEMDRTDRIHQRQKMLYGEGATPRLTYERAAKEAAGARTEFTSLDVLARQAEERVASILADLDGQRKVMTDRARELEDAEEYLSAGEIRAPADGIVVSHRGEVGKRIGEDGNLELFRIAVNTSQLQAVVDAEPQALARLVPGDEAMLFFADVPGEGIVGTVAAIADDHALVHFTSPTPIIRPGMTAQARLRLQ